MVWGATPDPLNPNKSGLGTARGARGAWPLGAFRGWAGRMYQEDISRVETISKRQMPWFHPPAVRVFGYWGHIPSTGSGQAPKAPFQRGRPFWVPRTVFSDSYLCNQTLDARGLLPPLRVSRSHRCRMCRVGRSAVCLCGPRLSPATGKTSRDPVGDSPR